MLESLIVRWGYLAIGLGTFLEGETILLAAGAMAHRGLLSLPLVMVSAFLGSLSGDQLWFYLGRRYGAPLLARHPKWSARLATAESALKRRGTWFVLGFRFVYGVRTVTPVLLGVTRYSPARFAALNAIGAAIWAVGFGAAGYVVGAAFQALAARAARLEEALVVGAAIAVAAWLVWRAWLRRSHPLSSQSSR